MTSILPIGSSSILSLGATVLLAHIGFTLLQIGLCQPKNTTSVIINNIFAIGGSGLIYWALGFAFAFGPSANGFISHSRFFLQDATDDELLSWYWHFALASLFLVIVNGGFVERLRFWVYPLLSIVLGGFFYPVASHWAWQKEGWLYKGLNNTDNYLISFQDNGGAGVIHVSAGGAALIGGILLGPRRGRMDIEGNFLPLGGETNSNILTGGSLAMVGLIAKNMAISGSSLGLTLVNCILSPCTSTVIAFMLKRSGYCGANWNTKTLMSAAITGLVAVSGSPHSYHPYGAFIIGIIAGFVYIGWTVALVTLNVDDVVDTIAVHLGGGLWGVIAAPMFNKTNGILYQGTGTSFQLFGWNILGGVALFVWSGLATFLLFIVFIWFQQLKYEKESKVHDNGIDVEIHHEPAYPHRATFPIHDETADFNILTDVKGEVKGIGDYSVGAKPIGYQNVIYDTNPRLGNKDAQITGEQKYWAPEGQQSHPLGKSTAVF